jgi:hypothetical protein
LELPRQLLHFLLCGHVRFDEVLYGEKLGRTLCLYYYQFHHGNALCANQKAPKITTTAEVTETNQWTVHFFCTYNINGKKSATKISCPSSIPTLKNSKDVAMPGISKRISVRTFANQNRASSKR